MTAAEIGSWHAILLATVVVLIANALIGFLRPGDKTGRIAFVQAFTATVLVMLNEITSRAPDGQAGIGIPIFLILFLWSLGWGLLSADGLFDERARNSNVTLPALPA